MRDEELRAAADSNYAESMRILVQQVCAHGRSERMHGLLLTSTGTDVGWLNIAFVLAPPPDPEAAFVAARRFYADTGEHWLMRIPAGLFEGVEAAAMRAGFRYSDDVPGMILRPLPKPAASYPIEVGRVEDAAGVAAFATILAACFGFGDEPTRALITDRLLKAPDVRAWLGYADGRPVATSMLIHERDIAGIWCVGTIEGYRGRGIGEAVTRRAVDEGTRMGCELANLQASEMGGPVYERMGFQVVSHYRTYLPEEIWGRAV
ncbi:MAG TPA: GNAT family N-acetyltransferase [Dehalococcoidia bacterium]|nr:GNAT family N-acetyltransferase [Dehalococcoidia bacterium]